MRDAADPPAGRSIERDLAERRKELGLLHTSIRLLHADQPLPALLERLVGMIPAGFQYPHRTAARVRWTGGAIGAVPADAAGAVRLAFGAGAEAGEIEVAYTGEDPPPFLPEEHELLLSLREIVHALIAQAERRRLSEALHEAERLEAVGRLAGGIAHDFNNLLTVVLGYATTLQEAAEPDDPRLPELAEIAAAATRAGELTHQLLAFSRRQVSQPEMLDLGELVRGLTGVLAKLLPADVALTVRVEPEPTWVRMDRAQLEQVLLNLVLNARDAMPRGGSVAVEVLRRAAPDGPRVVLAVTDSGEGMDEATRARVFEPFFTTRPFKGTGLGLASVHGIVQQGGGRIEVDSAPGQGSRFAITLPAAPRSAAPLPVSDEPADRAVRVLVVEDDPQVRRLAARTLRRAGYEVVEARHGPDALRQERGLDRLDLVVTDVVMPEIAGPELAHRLRARRPGLPVLFMSGHAADALSDGSLDGEAPLLHKPFAPAELVERVRQALTTPRS